MNENKFSNYIVVKSTKSTGIAILLTILLGPIGLFYASIRGGLIMTFTPIVLFILLFGGAVGGSLELLLSSFSLLLLFGLTSWLICIIWAITAVKKYNNELIANASQSNAQTFDNPSSIIPTNENSSSSGMYEPYDTGNSQGTAIIVTLGVIILVFLFFLYDKQSHSFQFNKLSNSLFDSHSKDKEEIKNLIENTYIEFFNGSLMYGHQNSSQQGGAFYNDSYILSIGSSMAYLFAMGHTIETKNINIYEFIDDNTAKVNFDLIDKERETANVITTNVEMVVKKIGGNWKLDGEKFLPFDSDKPKKHRKK